jgi:hypothetical protein
VSAGLEAVRADDATDQNSEETASESTPSPAPAEQNFDITDASTWYLPNLLGEQSDLSYYNWFLEKLQSHDSAGERISLQKLNDMHLADNDARYHC